MNRNFFLLPLASLLLAPTLVCAQVFEWEFVDPANPSLGKQKSATLAPDGASANFDDILGLAGRDLTKAFLFQANIRQFFARTTILNDAFLAEADMFNLQGDGLVARGADMSLANLQRARLVSSDLSMASFVNADLTNAYLGNSTLAGADFTSAKITDARFNGTTAKGFTAQQLYQTASYQQGELGAIQLSSNDLRGWNFTGQQMARANFVAAQLDGAVFSDAIVASADFSQSNLADAQLYSTGSYKNGLLDDILLNRIDISGWDFSGQSLVRTRITDTALSDAVFDGADLTNAFIGRDFVVNNDVSFRGANLTNATLDSNGRWERADFTEANLEGARLSSNGFVESNFDDAIIRGAELRSVFNFGFTLDNLYSTASYKSGDLTGIEVEYGDLTGADFRGIDLSGARLARLTLDGADFRGATIVDATIGASLEGADFRGANLTDTNFTYDPVSFIDFRGANLTGASFERASLVNADFTDATVFGSRLSVANSPQDLSEQQLYSTASYKTGLLGPITLTGDMREWNFQGQDLTGARFGRNSQLEGALWDGATLREALFFVNTMAETDFRNADVRLVRFSASNLDRSDFRSTDLSGAEFSSTSLIDARFDGALLAMARFVHANLQGVSFANADLRDASFSSTESFAGTDFSGADIIGANFSYATNDGFTVQQLRSTRSYQQRDLSGVDFEGASFPGIDLSGFRLAGGDFNRSNLVGANLSGTDLTGVSFLFADVTDLDLTDAIVRRANFSVTTSGGFMRDTLESTASYKNRELEGINLSSNDLRNWDFRSQDLREARFISSNLEGALFDLADLRGATLPRNLSGVDLQRAILSDGTLSLLRIDEGEVLTIGPAPVLIRLQPPNPRDPVDPNPIPLGVKVTGLAVQIDGTLELFVDESEWESTLVFNPQSEVVVDGLLKLDFDELAQPSAMVGQFYDLFDWPSERSGKFEVITDPNHIWDLSDLYTTGVVQLVAIIPEPSAIILLAGLLLSSMSTMHREIR